MEKLPTNLLNTYFEKSGDFYKIKDEVKNCVTFKQHNLLRDEYPKEVDLIVCRNVLIYFTEEAKASIYNKFNRALKKGSILFVGSTEQIIGSLKYGFTPLKTFFYSKENDLRQPGNSKIVD
jgi:chemotaxis protein methyltransferase CheR